MAPPRISVVVCTRNRPERLAAMLGSACEMRVPTDLSWELIVVENGQDEATAAVVQAVAGRLPIRRVIEPRAGLSHARNRGVAEAAGELICWTDDDVLVDREWLAVYAEALDRHPEGAIFGGKIIPLVQAGGPPWFSRHQSRWPLTSVMAQRDFGAFELPIGQGTKPWGANYAIRADAQRRALYNPELGLAPGRARCGEESDVIFRLLKSGASGWWVPAAEVRHVIGPERQSFDYVAGYFRQVGETAAHLHRTAPGDNAEETRRAPLFSYLSDPVVDLCVALNRLGAAAALGLGLIQTSLECLARQGFYEGVAGYRRAHHSLCAIAASARQVTR